MQVGCNINPILGYQCDNTGDNISSKNKLYCELTALYWAWKNDKSDIIGFVHYRRYFTPRKSKDIQDIIKKEEILNLLSEYDIIVPKPKWYLSSIKSHYIHCIKSRREANKKHIELLRGVICEICPTYLPSFDKQMSSHTAHMLNMFIMKKEYFNNYCTWLFPILFKLEHKLEENNIIYERIMGAFSEFLLDVWINYNHHSYIEIPILETEKNLRKKIKWAFKRMFFE